MATDLVNTDEKNCEKKIQEILNKYNCTLVYEELRQNGKMVAFEIKAKKVK